MIYVIDTRKLRRIMKDKNIKSVADLGFRIGKSRQTLHNTVFNNKYNIIKSNVQDVADYLNIDITEVIIKK